MAGKHGVKETKEALVALVALGGFVASRLKDGVDLGDLSAVVNKLSNDKEFVDKIKAGIEGIDKVDNEVSELDLNDGIELVLCLPILLDELNNSKKVA